MSERGPEPSELDSPDAVVAAVGRLAALPYGLVRTSAAEAAVRRAEAPGPEIALPYALAGLVDALFWGGEAERALVPFARLTRLADTRPELFDDVDAALHLGGYAWMLGGLQDDPRVPAATIDPLLADMERRYATAGRAPAAPAYERLRWSVRQERDDVEARYDAWLRAAEEPEEVCEHCRRTRRGIFLARTGRWAEVVAVLGAPGLPEQGCPTEPADMLSLLALAHLEAGQPEEALAVHRQAHAALPRASTAMEGARGRRIALLGRGGRTGAALRALHEDAHLLHEAITPFWRMQVLVLVGSATGVMRRTDPNRPVALHDVPASTVAELDDWVRARALELADAFGERAGSPATRERALAAMDAPPPPPLPDELPTDGDGRDGAGWSGDLVLAKAESLAAAPGRDPAEVVATYIRAAALLDGEGRTVDAGYALAEAAQAAALGGDPVDAYASFTAALDMLTVGGLDAEHLADVLVAATEAASVAAADLGAHLAVLEGHLDSTIVDLAVRTEGDAGRGAEHDAGSTFALARLRDARARLVATTAQGGGRARALAIAATDASSAAEALAGLGRVEEAGHAFWLAGRLHRERGRADDATWHLESAVEAFALRRATTPHALALTELVEHLRACGRTDDADETLRRLAP
ncbi:hypothetical protein [Litorihabitans aurantiacus]|uniref:Tetratricopeptide repeat protein n=1 Tax=Litorihabitans aurantiacus TaxID=1930061 RepID=A0AA37UKC3_9MICO|nr:hypothetical protein [Litorihabitans aurantiacus]GMA30670.1 hypothetical protein GCM10025875_06620 [Litorihabitans aurantiacus]